MKRTFAYGAATTQGSWHVQEDGFYADPGSGFFSIADGFGGKGCGDVAARLAIQESRSFPVGDRAPRESGVFSPLQAWSRELFGEVNKKLLQWNEKREPGKRGGCSLLVASVNREREVTLTGCGSCSAFLLRAGRWLPLLSPQAAPRSGDLEPLFPSQALGLGRELNPETRSFLWESGDILLLFSSGVAWEREGFQAELIAQLALRTPGSDLGSIAAVAAETGGSLAPWNQTALAIEAL